MGLIARSIRALEALSNGAGHLCALLTILVVVAVFGLALARYAFGSGSVALQDATQWLHAAAVLLGLAYALRCDSHVRVDVLSQGWSKSRRAKFELFGTIFFLLPFCFFLIYISWGYVSASWQMHERSANTGGLPGLYLVKSLLPLAALLLGIQGIAGGLRAWSIVAGYQAPMTSST